MSGLEFSFHTWKMQQGNFRSEAFTTTGKSLENPGEGCCLGRAFGQDIYIYSKFSRNQWSHLFWFAAHRQWRWSLLLNTHKCCPPLSSHFCVHLLELFPFHTCTCSGRFSAQMHSHIYITVERLTCYCSLQTKLDIILEQTGALRPVWAT